jgi:hypothetical protein
VVLALLWLALDAMPVWALKGGDQPREPGEKPKAEAVPVAGLVTEDLTTLTPEKLVDALVGQGITFSNVTYTGADQAAGTFSGGSGIIGFESGIILSTGDIANVVGPNQVDNVSADNGTAGDADLDALSGYPTNDAAVLEFDFVPDGQSITFDYVFASDEYNEFVHSEFNDVFAFYVNGVNCALVNSDPVSINSINNGYPFDTDPRENPLYYINNDLDDGGGSINTEMDGLTVVLTCSAAVNAMATNHIKLAIADASDSILDANVFLQQGSLVVDCCIGKNCPDDPEASKTCFPDTPPFYVVVNRTFEDLSRRGSGCQPIILKHPDCTDCCNDQDPACMDAALDLETRVCPMLASRVDWSQSTGSELVYEMCCDDAPNCKGDKWTYHERMLYPDGSCPRDPATCFDCLPPGTGIDLPAPLIVGGLALAGMGLMAAGLVVRRRAPNVA